MAAKADPCTSKDLLLLSLLGQENGLDVRQDASLGDGHARQQLVELFVVANGQLQVTGDDPGLLVVTGSVTGQLEHLSSQVLHDCSQVDWSACSYTFSIVALAQQTVDTSHGKLKASSAAARLGLSLDFASFAATRHDERISRAMR